MTVLRLLAGLALSLSVLAGCSGGTGPDANRPPSTSSAVFTELKNRFASRRGPQAPDPRQILTRQLIDSSTAPVLLVVVDQTDTALTLAPVSSNLGTVQWRDAAGGGLFFRDGVLVGTRGLGHDLLSADVAPLRAALRRGGGQDISRVNRILDGQNQVIAQQFICSVQSVGQQTLGFYGKTYQTVVFEENCVGDGESFTNTYWVEGNGTIRQSREHVSPSVGALTLSLLKA